jgi:GDP-L-fucose synthase
MPHKYSFCLDKKKIWIAGETGMVGQAVIRQLANENVHILSASHSELDLTNQVQTYDWIDTHKPDVIVMAAGKVGGIGANNNAPADFLFDNLSMAQNVIHGAFKAKVEKLLYLGSSCIYPKFAEQPIKEEALLTGELEPTNEAYALAKITGLKLCEFYRKQYGCDYISAMPTNLYGIHDHFDEEKSHVIPALILKIYQAKIENKDNVTLWGTGTPLREFLYVDDLAQALIHLIKNYSDGIPINIGGGEEVSIHDLAYMIAGVVGYAGKVIFDPTCPDGAPRKILDSGKVNNLGWSAETPLDKGLERIYQWFLKNI